MSVFNLFKITGLIILLVSSAAFSQPKQPQELSYHIKHLGSNKSGCLDISVKFKSNNDGDSLVKLPGLVGNAAFHAPKGNISYSMLDNRELLLRAEPNIDLEARYQACVDNKLRDNTYPIIDSDFFHFISEALLIFPGGDIEEKITAKFYFEDFPSDYVLLTNHCLNKREYEVFDTIRSLSRSILAGGKFEVETKYIDNKPIHIAMHGKWSMFENADLKSQLYKIMNAQKAFLNDYNFPHFALIIFDNTAPKENGAVSGLLFENVLTMLVMDGKKENKPLLYGLFSHELFHAWIGNKIRIPEPQGDLQWFFEGVNDFYGWQLALDAGIISKEHYLKYYNRVITEYELSPYKTDSNKLLSKGFNLKNHSARLPMFRTHIIFMEILNKLKSQGKDRAPIDKALYDIVENYSGKNIPLSNDILNAIFKKYLGDEIWNEASKAIFEGEQISLSSKVLSDKVILKNVSMSVPDFGLNLNSLAKEKRIVSLAKDSNAFLAGLKEDDKVLEGQFDMTSATSPVYMKIERLGEQKVIHFSPKISQKRLPQYVMNKSFPR